MLNPIPFPHESSGIRLRPIAPRDVAVVKAIEEAWPLLSHWDVEVYRKIAEETETAHGFVSVEVSPAGEERVTGFLIYRTTQPDTEILNIAVDPSAVRRKVATRLLHHLVTLVQPLLVKNLFLEVRPTNDPAREFYLKEGFVEVGRRKAYYNNPPEDAILMKRELR